jgi:isopenicillin-N N-acyltransferase-like protein
MYKRTPVRKKILKGLLILLLALLLLFIISVFKSSIEHPPEVSDLTILQTKREKVNQNTYFFGNNWIRKSESGLYEMYIEGGAFERGVAFGRLTEELLFYQESAFTEQIKKLVPSELYLKFLKYFVAWFGRNLDKAIPEEFRLEIYGTSFSSSPSFEFIGTGYQRQLNYHAAHDIGHALQSLNMVACTSFSCWGGKSEDSTLITGRNFDFYMGKKFSENKIVCFFKPDTGYRFMMITWADFIGVVSGMNEKGLTVTINASKSSIPAKASTPVSLLAREILQYAANLDQAIGIARKRKLFVSESILVSSVADGKSTIIEKTPDKSDVFYSETNKIVCANHFQGDVFLDDKTNLENIRGSDSKYRFNRVNELLSENKTIDVQGAVSILRDMQGPDHSDPGLGNPLAVNQLIAHHSIVFKPAKQMVWVSTDPYQLGRFVAYDLKKVFSMTREQVAASIGINTPELTVPADSFLYSTNYINYTRYLKLTEELKNYTGTGNKLPEYFESNYIKTNPELYLTYSYLGDYFFKIKDYSKASDYYQTALSKEVAGQNERDKLMNIAKKAFKKQRDVHSGN